MTQLTASLPIRERIVDRPPVRIMPEGLVVPDRMELTVIGANHDSPSVPDYLEDMLAEADPRSTILLVEQSAWIPEQKLLLQLSADGNPEALERTLYIAERLAEKDAEAGAWDATLYRALHNSGVRIGMSDYRKGHPLEARMKQLIGDGTSYTKDLTTFPLFRDRELAMTNRMCKEIAGIRRVHKDLVNTPVRAIALLGAAHFAIHDAIAAAAEDQGVDLSSKLSFHKGDLFSVDPSELDPERKVRVEAALEPQINYQNWLRTPDKN